MTSLWIRGKSLEETRALYGALASREAARMLLPIAADIALLHASGRFHGGISMTDIVLGTDPFGRDVPKLLASPRPPQATTLAFAAPELLDEPGNPRPSSDVWALGIVLYGMLTGSLPFDGLDDTDVRQALRTDALVPIRARRTGLDPDIVDVVNTAISSDLSVRYRSAADFGAALARSANLETEWQLELAMTAAGAMKRSENVPTTLLSSPLPVIWRGSRRRGTVALLLATLALIGVAAWLFVISVGTLSTQDAVMTVKGSPLRSPPAAAAPASDVPQVPSTPASRSRR